MGTWRASANFWEVIARTPSIVCAVRSRLDSSLYYLLTYVPGVLLQLYGPVRREAQHLGLELCHVDDFLQRLSSRGRCYPRWRVQPPLRRWGRRRRRGRRGRRIRRRGRFRRRRAGAPLVGVIEVERREAARGDAEDGTPP